MTRRVTLLPVPLRYVLLLCVLVLCVLVTGVAVSDDPVADNTAGKEVDRLRALARRFVQKERPGDAERQLVEALSLAPDSHAVLADLLALCEQRPDDLWLWSYHAAGRTADVRGKTKTAKFPRAAQVPLRAVAGLAAARAGAMKRLASAARRTRSPEEAFYLRALGRVLTEGAPVLWAKHGAAFQAGIDKSRPDPSGLLNALAREMRGAKPPEDVRAAAILRGLCAQAKRREEPVRGLAKLDAAARKVLDRTRRAIAPMTVDELGAIAPRDRPAWEAAHADWSNPTVVESPNKRYRIESICGVRTTLIVAADVEYQHARLAAWFGRDPFEKRQGTIRVAPTRAELETEGAPFWWAGGFQSGSVTTIAVHATGRGSIASLLTHELTHRFDGAVFPLMAGWLVEGRAVHTAACSLWARAEKLDERVAAFGRISKAWDDGYHNKNTLRKLIEGQPEDYRHNYSAGYALWIYLTRRRAGQYAKQVEPYLKSFRMKPGWPPFTRFEKYLLDGRGGRAKDFDTFAKDFAKFVTDARVLGQTDWEKKWRIEQAAARKAMMSRQALAIVTGGRAELGSPFDNEILDRSNWGRRRNGGDEPAFGEDHAYAAGLWFERNGKADSAARAFAWARLVDELTVDQRRHVAAYHRARGKPAAAWLWHRDGKSAPAAVLSMLRPVMPVVRELAGLQDINKESARPRAARAALADRVRLVTAAGLKPFLFRDTVRSQGKDAQPPDCPPYECVLDGGLVAEYWSPFESQKQTGNWHVAGGTSLVIGTRKPLDTTTGFRKDAGVRKVFLRTKRRYQGTYTLRTRVRLPSAHMSGALIVGHTRHDRGLVVHLGGGDWAYAVGRKEQTAGFKSIRVSINDLRSFDGGVGRLGTRVAFRSPKTSFLVAVRVSGSFVRVEIDGKVVLTHRTTPGVNLEGHIGFWLGSGLVAFERPEVRRHRVLGPGRTSTSGDHDAPLDFSQPVTLPVAQWPGRRVAGLKPQALGTLLLVYTDDAGHRTDPTTAAKNMWRGRLGDEVLGRLVAVRPKVSKTSGPAKESEEAGGGRWKGTMEHAGVPRLKTAREEVLKRETKRLKKDRNLDDEAASKKATDELRFRPAWAVVDEHGIVRAAGTWLSPWNGYPAVNLLRRLRGY